MKPEEQLLLACTRAHFDVLQQKRVIELCRQASLDWNYLYTTAQGHGVAPLIYRNLQQCDPLALGVPPLVWQQWKHAAYRNIALMSGLAVKLQELLAFFNARSIDVLLVKGTALDIVAYDQPWYTRHDVDLVLRPRRSELSAADNQAVEAYFAKLHGFEYDFYEHHDVTMNGVLPVNFARIWADAVPITYRGQALFVMSPEDLLLAACINSCRKRYFRLKSLLDIAEIINAYPNLDWNALLDKASAYDCHLIVHTALTIAQQTVGCSFPATLLAEFNVPAWRAHLIQRLSRHLSLSAFATLAESHKLLGRSLALSLVLPYLTLRGYQIGRRLRFVWRTRDNPGT